MTESESPNTPPVIIKNVVLGWMNFSPGSTRVTFKYVDEQPGKHFKDGTMTLDPESHAALRYLQENILGTPHQKRLGEDASPGVVVNFSEHNGVCTVTNIGVSDRFTTIPTAASGILARLTGTAWGTPKQTETLLERVKSMMSAEPPSAGRA